MKGCTVPIFRGRQRWLHEHQVQFGLSCWYGLPRFGGCSSALHRRHVAVLDEAQVRACMRLIHLVRYVLRLIASTPVPECPVKHVFEHIERRPTVT